MAQLIVTVDSLYRRKTIPASLPDDGSVVGKVYKGFTFSGTLVPSAPGQVAGGWYKDADGYYYWGGGVAIKPIVAPNAAPVPTPVNGIDVSRYQAKAIFWPLVKKTMSFVYVKSTEGAFTIDPLCHAHASGAKAAGLKIGYYHFGVVSRDAALQAKHFHQSLTTMPAADLMPVLDIETNKANLSQEEMEAWITAFIKQMNELGHQQVMIYSCCSFLNQNLSPTHGLGKYPLWLAEYTNAPVAKLPTGWASFTVWQYSEEGKVEGITDTTDMNRAIAGFA